MSSKSQKDMVINYVPGEECRVALVEDGRLEELHAERMDNASHVGNIYVGKVVNVEPGIQAAFVDFGLEANGFLHVTDLHPRYFPGEDAETTERVGKKTPRRERPPIQACLRRGQEIAVQVLKEGVGTKGPTVTSYLSIPGRFLVMMPLMDKVGVSRKVEDEDTRRKMREILDQLDLPEGFGFILRTAGMDRGKMELKRDLAYLQRLWKDMEKRWKTGSKPRLLYSESDLLVRALRDILTTDINRVVIDNESALNRAARFLKIVAPRSTTRLVRYTGNTPVFHALGVEQQIQMIHAREVPLPGGGRLVIDETEALVAIDVNSGKMRDARDAETTAYRTNMEAADEIARQLRLRDVGGVIVNDFIDMRAAKHRRDLENRFKDNLKKDRARTTTAPVSPFGVIEMTRQRMRGSHESVHFAPCPTCRGRGLLQKPDSVAGDGLRELQAYLASERVVRVELVVNPRIAGELLSSKRRALMRIERSMGKRVDVRVSEAIPLDRVSFYAYDDRGADIDLAKLRVEGVRPDQLVAYEAPDMENWAEETAQAEVPDEPVEEVLEPDLHPIEVDDSALADDGDNAGWGAPSGGGGAGASAQDGGDRDGRGRGRRRGGRGGRGRGRGRDEQGSDSRGSDSRGSDSRNAGSRGHGTGTAAPHAAAGASASPLRLIDSDQDLDATDDAGISGGTRGGDAAGQRTGDGEGGPRRRRRRGGRGRGRGRGGDGPRDTGGPSGGANVASASSRDDEPSRPDSWGAGEGELDQRDPWSVDSVDAGEAPLPEPRGSRSAEDDLAEAGHDSREAEAERTGDGPAGRNNAGPEGPDGMDGQGRRKRRRGRRGGRGRRRREGGEGGDLPGSSGMGTSTRSGSRAPTLSDALESMTSPTRDRDENRADATGMAGGDDSSEREYPASGFEESDFSDAEGSRDERDVDSPQGESGSEGDLEGGGEGGRRRRRRRRGGRGRRGGGGGGGERGQANPAGGSASRESGPGDSGSRDQGRRLQGQRGQGPREQAPREQASRDQGRRESGPGSGGRNGAPSSPPARSASPAPAPNPQAPGPRTLYGGARRKLGPGDLRSRPKDE